MLNKYLTRKQFKGLVEAGLLIPTNPVGQYPVSTRDAAQELRLRGLKVSYDQLRYMISRGDVQPDGGGSKGSEFRWLARHIDAAAKVCADNGWFTPYAVCASVLNMSLVDFIVKQEYKHQG